VALSTPALRAKTLERHSRWAELLAPVLLLRLGESGTFGTIVADSLVQSALSSLYVATDAWVKAGGAERYGELLDVSFEAIKPLQGEAGARSPSAVTASVDDGTRGQTVAKTVGSPTVQALSTVSRSISQE
jgi:hypothetical protein